MFQLNIGILLVIFTVFGNNASGQETLKQPTPITFLTWLLNTTVSNVGKVAEDAVRLRVSNAKVKYFLYANSQTMNDGYLLLTDEFIDLTQPTIIIIHGWRTNGTADFIQTMAKEYHQNFNNYTVISVDWSEAATQIYLYSAASTRSVGENLGDFLLKSIRENFELLANIHLIGHSLGAQIAGFAGQYIIEKTGKKLDRITGLDVAAPLFEIPVLLPDNSRLTKSDANYVDSIHTNAGFFGFRSPVGDVDFYINFGGPIQPDCADINVIEAFACSHTAAIVYYIEAINGTRFEVSCPKLFEPILCKTTEITLGENVQRSLGGVYFVSK